MDGDRMVSLSRRTAMMATGTGIGVGIALAAGPVQAQHQVTTIAEGLTAGPVWVSTAASPEPADHRLLAG